MPPTELAPHALADSLRRFDGLGTRTAEHQADFAGVALPVLTNEFWTARQRAAHSLHEISYRACFKPQLPRFFIERLTAPGDLVYDPFMGRGTTVLEAALLGRRPAGCDINPLSRILCEARLHPPSPGDVREALAAVPWDHANDIPEDLLVFYHPDTLRRLCALREHLLRRERDGALTAAERWVRMVAVNRLTGHSPGFFSAYSLPPNQAVSVRSQARINERLQQRPPLRDVAAIIERKTRALLSGVTLFDREQLREVTASALLLTGSSSSTPAIADSCVRLVVTSPPFLDVVDYRSDNWLRCWFCGVDTEAVPITMSRRLDAWRAFVTQTLRELARVLAPGGIVAFEVGEVRGATVRLEEEVVPAGIDAGLEPLLVVVNAQSFTKTANCWGVTNNARGTNTNRIVVLRRPA